MADIIFGKDGTFRHIYNEDLEEISKAVSNDRETTRASHVEPTNNLSQAARNLIWNQYAGEVPATMEAATAAVYPPNKWWADMIPSGGTVLGPFDKRSEALDAELKWLDEHNIPSCRNCAEKEVTPE